MEPEDSSGSRERDAPASSDRRSRLLRRFARDLGDRSDVDISGHSAVFLELPKLELSRRSEPAPSLSESNVRATVDHVLERRDCADFGLNGLLRAVYRYGPSTLDRILVEEIDDAATGFAYWFDEPGDHDAWFCTENHQILYHAAELLAGQRFPDERFESDGATGTEHRKRAERRVRRWLDWRLRFGYSEWLSNAYYDEDVLALLNLVDFAEDAAIRRAAEGLLAVTLFEIAVNTYDGTFGSSHGRAYARHVLDPRREPTGPLSYLLGGREEPPETLSRSAISLAASDYSVPAVIRSVARDEPAELEHRQRQGVDVGDAREFGLDPDDPDDQLFFWGELTMGHREVVDAALETCPARYRPRFREIEPAAAYHAEAAASPGYVPDPNNTAMTESNTYTYRTPSYMLSCVQDFRKGRFGFQHHVWQATLGGRALVFTNHPKTDGEGASLDGRWGGTGLLPRAAAHRNVVCCLYRVGRPPHDVPDIPGFDPDQARRQYTHAYVPRFAFDDVRETDRWVVGKKGQGYVAITATAPTRWADPRDGELERAGIDRRSTAYELVADGVDCAWICELGSERSHGSFPSFVDAIEDASVAGDTTEVSYDSPALGPVEFGWEESFRVDGSTIDLGGYPRFESPYCSTPFGSSRYELHRDDEFDVDPPDV